MDKWKAVNGYPSLLKDVQVRAWLLPSARIGRLLGTVAVLVSFLVSADPAKGQLIKRLEFDVDGVLPSSEPDIEFANNTGHSEAELYSVSGGLLHQSTFDVNGSAYYGHPNAPADNGVPVLDATLALIVETRAQAFRVEGHAGGFIEAYDGANRYTMEFSDDAEGHGVLLQTDEGGVLVEVEIYSTNRYRLESDADSDSLRLFVNNELRFEGNAPSFPDNWNGFEWGDGHSPSGHGADIDWDFVRVWQQPCVLFSDLDYDGTVGQADLGILLASFGTDDGGDIDRDDDTDQSDLGILLAHWGEGCGTP